MYVSAGMCSLRHKPAYNAWKRRVRSFRNILQRIYSLPERHGPLCCSIIMFGWYKGRSSLVPWHLFQMRHGQTRAYVYTVSSCDLVEIMISDLCLFTEMAELSFFVAHHSALLFQHHARVDSRSFYAFVRLSKRILVLLQGSQIKWNRDLKGEKGCIVLYKFKLRWSTAQIVDSKGI